MRARSRSLLVILLVAVAAAGALRSTVQAQNGGGSAAPPRSSRRLDGVAARVEGAVITWNDVRRALGNVMKTMGFTNQAERERELARLAYDHLRKLVQDELLLNRALAEGVQVPAETIEAAFQRDVRSVGSLEEFEKVLAEKGMTVQEKKAEIRNEYLRNWYLASTRQRTPWSKAIRAYVMQVRPTEMKAYYREHREDYRQRATVWLRQAHISSAEQGGKKKAEVLAEAVIRDLKQGMSPAEVDAKHELGAFQFTCPFEDLDPIYPDSGLLRALKAWAFKAAKGDVLGPVRFPSGDIKVFYLEKRQAEVVRGFGEVQDEIRDALRRRMYHRAEGEIVRSLLKTADLEPPELKAFMLDPRQAPRMRRDVLLALLDNSF